MKSTIKKNTIEKTATVYKMIAESFKFYKFGLNKLKERIDQIDFSETIYIDNFLNSYDAYLSDLANSIGNLFNLYVFLSTKLIIVYS